MPFKEILLASQNAHKIKEINDLLPDGLHLKGIEGLFDHELPETGATLEENALQKARYVFSHTGIPALADDTGLEVEALHGAPGVYSARYAGEEKNPQNNIRKLLQELNGKSNRIARFRTVMAFCNGTSEWVFEGVVNGVITTGPRGDKGFGYDPVFIPDGFDRTFAEMTSEEKNSCSHRARALQKVIAFFEKSDR
ncbi:MAG: non-canonical purine NTP diphosphatase [Bacteroidia bacterium]